MSRPQEEKIKRLERQNAILRQNIYEMQEQKAAMQTTISGLQEEIRKEIQDKNK